MGVCACAPARLNKHSSGGVRVWLYVCVQLAGPGIVCVCTGLRACACVCGGGWLAVPSGSPGSRAHSGKPHPINVEAAQCSTRTEHYWECRSGKPWARVPHVRPRDVRTCARAARNASALVPPAPLLSPFARSRLFTRWGIQK